MKKTRHQIFVDELHRQLTYDTGQGSDSPGRQGTNDDSGRLSREDILRNIERKFDELFENLDTDDAN